MPESLQSEARLCGDDLFTLPVADAATAQRLAAVLRGQAYWLEVVPGLNSVVVQFDAATTDAETARKRLRALPVPDGPAAGTAVPLVRVPVRYGGEAGPDFDAVCRKLGLSRDELISAHTGGAHCVAMLGFTPGFAYVAGLDPRLDVGRLASPRQRVPAGSVGIAGAYTGLYALAGPGGWPLIGRTELALFDAGEAEAFKLAPGQRIRFEAVGA